MQSPKGIIISREQILWCKRDHKPLNKFLNSKNANNKVNRWGLELATYNITFEWISGACNKAAHSLSCLVELSQDTPVPINMLSVTNTDGPAFNTGSQTHQHFSPDTFHLTARCHAIYFTKYRSYTKIPNSR